MTITNQTNPVGSEYTSKKNGINVPKELISGPGRTQATKIFTAVRITKTKNVPPEYTKEVIQYPDAKSSSFTVIAKEKKEKGKPTGEFEFNLGVDYKGTDKEEFKRLVNKQIKNQTKDAEGQLKNKINPDKTAINGNKATTGGEGDSTNSNKTKKDPRGGIGRKNYGVMIYPSFIEKSSQDKLKITILEFSSRFKGGKLNAPTKKTANVKTIPKYEQNRRNNRPFPKSRYSSGVAGLKKNKSGSIKKENGSLSLDNSKRIEASKRTLGHITLPIPNGVTDQNRVTYTDGRLNPFQAGAAEVALKTLLKGFGEGGKAGADFITKAITNKDLGTALASIITSSALGIDNNELLARTEGNIFNNNLELLFKGPTLRPFNFQYKLSPRDQREARQVQKIIRAFKQSSAVQRTNGGMFLASPNTFKLEFINGRTSKVHEFLPKIKECALLSVGVDYMPENSYMTYEDTSMVAYSLTLAFQELLPIFNDDYEANDTEQTGTIPVAVNNDSRTTGDNIGF